MHAIGITQKNLPSTIKPGQQFISNIQVIRTKQQQQIKLPSTFYQTTDNKNVSRK